jgi:hypothetical protein
MPGHLIPSLADYIAEVFALRARWYPGKPCEEIWFRGINNATLDLLPGAYWRKDCDENSLALSFRAAVPGLLPHQPADDWEWYYLMQHYGLPTRLLDWSESPLAALYFALESVVPGAAPCVWALDPLALNKLSGENAIMTPTRADHPVRNWLPGKCYKGARPVRLKRTKLSFLTSNRYPLAVYPKRHNPRIIAQRGTFTVHGVRATPINKLPVRSRRGVSGVVQLRLDPKARSRLFDELWGVGINKTAIYPEPQSLAEDLRRMYGVI